MPITYFNHYKASASKARSTLIIVILIFTAILCTTSVYENGFKNIKTSFIFFIVLFFYGAFNFYIIAPILSKRVGISIFIVLMTFSAMLTCGTLLLLFKLNIIEFPQFIIADTMPQRMMISMFICVGLVLFFAGRFLYLFFSTFQLSNEKVKNELDSYHHEINSMRLQINPNLLYNSLNNLRNLLENAKLDEALKFNTETYLLLEKQIKYAQKETIRLQDDIEWIEHYLKTQQLSERFSFQYSISISDSELLLQEIPPILLQPVLETFISKLSADSNQYILINIEDLNAKNGSGIFVTLKEDVSEGKPMENNASSSIKNLEKRIELINKIGKFEIQLSNEMHSNSRAYFLKILEKS